MIQAQKVIGRNFWGSRRKSGGICKDGIRDNDRTSISQRLQNSVNIKQEGKQELNKTWIDGIDKILGGDP